MITPGVFEIMVYASESVSDFEIGKVFVLEDEEAAAAARGIIRSLLLFIHTCVKLVI